VTPQQESVWDYPRPPRVEAVTQQVSVCFAGEIVAETDRALRVLETSHPPVYYLPPHDIGWGAQGECIICDDRRTRSPLRASGMALPESVFCVQLDQGVRRFLRLKGRRS
jgi:hypothetical protein